MYNNLLDEGVMEKIIQLCKSIDMPSEVIEKLREIGCSYSLDEALAVCANLTDKRVSAESYKKLDNLLNSMCKSTDDVPRDFEKGYLWLYVSMYAASEYSKKLYESHGIDEKVFIDTMACFTRFVMEHKESFGFYGFDRAFWTYRQLSLLLFRVGTLEFEFCTDGISVHIPSDADLSDEAVQNSYKSAKDFIMVHFHSDYTERFYCCSWLLAPSLKKLLPETSKIIKFQSAYDIYEYDEDDKEYVQWVYKDSFIPVEQWPENTTLQKNMKHYVLNGGKIGFAKGVLKGF